jgi:hypothetical protein
MKRGNVWTVVILGMVGLLVAACAPAPAVAVQKIPPVKVERIEGTDLSRLTLTAEAAKRLDIQTAPVREEQVTRQRKVGGSVMAPPAGSAATTGGMLVSNPESDNASISPNPSQVLVSVRLNESDLRMVDRSKPAQVLPLGGNTGAADWTARRVEAPAGGDAEAGNDELYYAIDSADSSLAPGQRVLVQVTLVGGGMLRKLIPYAAVIYDAHGDTWVYANPQPLVFVRHRISVNYIEGDLAVLFAGPAAGTQVVTVGAAELYGAETGVGK